MESYFLLKLLHILAAVTVAGTGAGIAFFMFMANRSNNPQAIAVTARHVVLADWLFTTPAVIIQFVTGLLLMNRLGFSYTSDWFLTVMALFIFIGLCWLPVVVMQYRLKALAEVMAEATTDKATTDGTVPDSKLLDINLKFKRLMRWWTALGIPAFLAILVIFWLMVFKPLSVV